MGKLDRGLIRGAGASFYCSRVRAYMKVSECLSAYKFAKEKGTKNIPCVECSRVALWAKAEKRAESIRKIKRRKGIDMPKKKEVTTNEELVEIVVDFSDRPGLLVGLSVSAKENFRTPEQQVLFLIHNHILGKKAHAKKGA